MRENFGGKMLEKYKLLLFYVIAWNPRELIKNRTE